MWVVKPRVQYENRRTCVHKIRKLSKGLSNKNTSLQVVADFLTYCQTLGLSTDTIKSHNYALNNLFSQSNLKLDDNLGIKNAITKILQNAKDAYCNKQLNAYRTFFKFCISEGYTASNPALSFKYRK